MRRSRLESILHDYVAGDLDEEARRAIERRIQAEPDTRALLDEVRSAHEALLTLRERPEPPASATDVMPRIQAAISAQSFETRPQLHLEGQGARFYRRIAAAATLLLAVTVGAFGIQRLTAKDAADPVVTPIVDGETDVRPSAETRGLEHFVEAGTRPGGLPADEWLRMLAEAGRKDVRFTPDANAVPITFNVTDDR